jgi:NAD(P)-dependent dehydrogenase (short-subunit alcohol dehydrogenase family)
LRGALTTNLGNGAYQRWILEFRQTPDILRFVNGADLLRYSQAGVATPDHVIRIKGAPLVTDCPETGKLEVFEVSLRQAVQRYVEGYQAYFARNNARQKTPKKPLDPLPRVVMVPGVGLFGLGRSAKEAAIAADVAEAFIDTVIGAEMVGRFESIRENELFDMEYWSLEQAKLGTARAMAREGAEVVLVDQDEDKLTEAAGQLSQSGIMPLVVAADVTRPEMVRFVFDRACQKFGGVDIVVSNAGAAWQGRIGDVGEDILRRSFELNFFAHQHVSQQAVRVMRAQRSGGVILYNVSKQAINPGPDFGPYGLPKAATLFLARQYALDHARDGIRTNVVNADRIRSGLLTEEMIAERAKARGIDPRTYMSGNLLGVEVTAEDVAQAFVHLALANKTTASVTTVDGGNIAAVLR